MTTGHRADAHDKGLAVLDLYENEVGTCRNGDGPASCPGPNGVYLQFEKIVRETGGRVVICRTALLPLRIASVAELTRSRLMRMIAPAIRSAVALAFFVSASCAVAAQTTPARAYCATRGHADVERVPPELLASMQAFGVDASTARNATYVRCVGPTLMVCFVGANLSCAKADKRRFLKGATAFCRENPDAAIVPMVATGHGTIYDWSCQGQRAVAGKASAIVDPQGYIASNWHEMRARQMKDVR